MRNIDSFGIVDKDGDDFDIVGRVTNVGVVSRLWRYDKC